MRKPTKEVAAPDFSKVRELAKEHIDHVNQMRKEEDCEEYQGYDDDDRVMCIYEEVMKALYGDSIMEYLNPG